ncbi:DNA mismatch repair protein MutL [Paxillus ammoniavirescens]|nr:DNA mismatch repair protein MutL [Paxillus ammoniavirescens]
MSGMAENLTGPVNSHDVARHPDLSIRAIDAHSVHRITSGQVVIDLQTAVKELVENSLDAGATNIEVRFQNYGLKAIEVVDNGSGIAPKDYDSLALKHYTSKLSSFEDLSRVLTFGFRGEALSSLCALSDGFSVSTATFSEAPMGTTLEMDRNGKVRNKGKVARQRGTTVTVTNLFKPLPVRRKEFERNTKREFQKASNLLHAYALVPCARENKGVRLTVSNQTEAGRKTIQFKTDGTPSMRASVLALWGSKALENIVDLDLSFVVETEKSVLRRQGPVTDQANDILSVTPVKVQGLISKFAVGAGRTSMDRQYFFVNGRPYNPGKVQKAINEVYRTFSANQSPFVIADFILPTHACDINVSPDKRTIFLHSENNLVQALKIALEDAFSSARSTYDTRSQPSLTQTRAPAGARAQQPTQALAHKQAQMQTGRSSHSQHGPTAAPAPTRAPNDSPQSAAPQGSPPPGARGSRSPSPPPPRNDGRNGEGGGEVSMGAPHLLLDPDTGSEPEPTLVPQPSSTHTGNAWKDKYRGLIDRPRSRAPSEPLFFPESDEEGAGESGAKERVDKGKGRAVEAIQSSAESRNNHTRSLRPPAIRSSTAATATTVASTFHPKANTLNKPRSVQTVLNTRGAAWNPRNDADKGEEPRKRARVSSDRMEKTSLKSRLSQFASSGSQSLGRRDEGDEGRDEGGGKGGGTARKRSNEMEADDEEEVDELDGDGNEDEETLRLSSRAAKVSKTVKRTRAGSVSSQGTMVLPSDDEGAMDVDEPPSATLKSSRIATSHTRASISSTVQVPPADIVDLTEDDWDMSSTLVGTYVPPPGKTTASSSSSRSRPAPADSQTDFVTLHVDLVSVGSQYLDLYTHLTSKSQSSPPPVPTSTPSATLRSAVSSANLETAAADNVASAALSRIISKADFEHMQILGQFNLGFIIWINMRRMKSGTLRRCRRRPLSSHKNSLDPNNCSLPQSTNFSQSKTWIF